MTIREMQDGIRKVLLKRESARAGKDVFAFKVPYRDANGKQSSETFRTRKAAVAFRDKVRGQRSEGLVMDVKAGQITFSEFSESWLETHRVTRRAATHASTSSNVRTHLIPAFGKRQLRAINRAEVQTFVTGLSRRDLSPYTVRRIYKVLAQVMRSAVLDHVIASSPCVGIALPEITRGQMKALTAGQVSALADKIDDQFRGAVLLAAATGLRPSEVWGLTWDRIDLEGGTLRVDRQLHFDRRRLAPVKTRASERTVPLPAVAAAALRRHRDAYPPVPVDLDHSDGYTVEGAELVFHNGTGQPVVPWAYRDEFRLACAALGLPKSITPHALRHTYASLLIDARTPLKAIQERLGHSSITVTMDTYGHLYPAEDIRTRSAIDDAFKPGDNEDPPAAVINASR